MVSESKRTKYYLLLYISNFILLIQKSFKYMTSEVGFAVQPKLDCPHLTDQWVQELIKFLTQTNDKHFSEFQCTECHDKSQNWICLECRTIKCSRYVKSHMVEHNDLTKHTIALSFSDASFWCYVCDSYIDAPSLRGARITLSNAKFAMPSINKQEDKQQKQEKQLQNQLQKMVINQQKKPLSLQQLVERFKKHQFKNVAVLTGAGLSVAAGIPDFRSPGTGLYSKLAKYNLPAPELVFDIRFFSINPEPFSKVAEQFLTGQFQPTLGHKFIKKLYDQGLLLMNFTQNIDDLQSKIGLPQEKLLQAHGHGRSAHCIKCSKEVSVEEWRKNLKQKGEVLVCECGSYTKPDIVFFGEQLPKSFQKAPELMQKADLVIIIGTSLKVMPFAFLAHMIDEKIPVVLINNEDSLSARKDKLWMKGDIQDNIKTLIDSLQWKL